MTNKNTIKVLVVGCGHMGTSHAKAYQQLSEFEIVGLVSRSPKSRNALSEITGWTPDFRRSYGSALKKTQPDAVSINTYPDTHFEYVKMALNEGAHVFVEKPLALTVKEAEDLVTLASKLNKKLVVGYILRVHPAWTKFINIAQSLGKPLVMRMNLNQQSSGPQWYTHQQLMKSMSPIVDCGVHYVDVMCLMTKSQPISVSAIGARLSNEIDTKMYNYGQLQVRFKDGSVGWYEAGWGPMMSETAFFVKDVIGPEGCVSIIDESKGASDDVEGHTKTGGLKIHFSALDKQGSFKKVDQLISTEDEPDHDGLCFLEQQYFLKSILEDSDLSAHLQDAINSLRVVLAADTSVKTGKTVLLK